MIRSTILVGASALALIPVCVGAQDSQNQGREDKPRTVLEDFEADGKFLNTVLGYADKGNAITGGMLAAETKRLDELSSALGRSLNKASEAFGRASTLLEQRGKLTQTLLPEAELRWNRVIEANNRMNATQRQVDMLSARLANATAVGAAISPDDLTELERLVNLYNERASFVAEESAAFKNMNPQDKYALAFDASDPSTARLLERVEKTSGDLAALGEAAKDVEAQATTLQRLVKRIPTEKISKALEYFGESPAGRILDKVSHGMNTYTVGASFQSTIDAAYNDKSIGQIKTTRDYSLSGLALDLAALAGHAVSGNVPGFFSDASAITLGSVGDIFLSAKALKDTHQLNLQLIRQTREMDAQLSEMRHGKVISLEGELREAGVELSTLEAKIDASTGMAKDLLAERRAARAEVRRQEEEARLRQEERDRQMERERIARTEENDRRRTANDRLKEAVKPDYPTAPTRIGDASRPDKSEVASAGVDPTPEDQRAQEIQQKKEEAQHKLDAYQEQKLAKMNADEAARAKQKGTPEFRISQLETSALLTSSFDIKAVAFEGPTFKPPVFEMPKWVPPEFDAPDISRFSPTNPEDLNGYPGSGQMPAFTYASMSGQQPDLAQWADWLATQDIRLLEQLAIASGYPSLAFALADGENIIRKAQDQGYRAYANRGPNCAGYTGCTGSLGPWKLAYATVRLGDILAQSRGIFSTGGFSDIGISGFNLMYLLRDFGAQDGDLIDVEISQFGREIFKLEGHFLLNAGSEFDVQLRPGVAQMVITALNEGTARPNTAELQIENVVRGEARQAYSLSTGQTAVLRIESNAQPASGGIQ